MQHGWLTRRLSPHGGRRPNRAWARFVSAACLVSLLAGCVQGPDYVKPTVAVPSAYRYGGLPLEVPIGPSWWNGFDDKHLDELVHEALANNRDLRIATARVDEFGNVLIRL